jgi:uncharacterized Zn-binding protein involved in type VI secretion
MTRSRDDIDSQSDTRLEVMPNGAVVPVQHASRAALTSGLAAFFRLNGSPVALVGSSGTNQSAEHRAQKQGAVLIPFPLTLRIVTGSTFFRVTGRPVAHQNSKATTPDVVRPIKEGVVQVRQKFFCVGGNRVMRGS